MHSCHRQLVSCRISFAPRGSVQPGRLSITAVHGNEKPHQSLKSASVLTTCSQTCFTCGQQSSRSHICSLVPSRTEVVMVLRSPLSQVRSKNDVNGTVGLFQRATSTLCKTIASLWSEQQPPCPESQAR